MAGFDGVRRFGFIGLTIALWNGAAAVAAPPPAVATGYVTGTIAAGPLGGTASEVTGVPTLFRIVVRTADGVAAGSLHFNAPKTTPDGSVVLPYIITNVPLGVELHVAAEPIASPAPLPTGFATLTKLEKAAGDERPFYAVTLTANHRKGAGCDFVVETLEVPPAPPEPRAPPSPSPGPPSPAGSATPRV